MARVMIIEDHKDIAQTLKAIIEKIGHQATVCNNGAEFLEQVENVNPDLVLLDVMMPGLTTKEILANLKERKNPKIILISVIRFSDEEITLLKENNKIVDYITKPFAVADLMNRVSAQLEVTQ